MLKLKQINKEYKTGELVQHALNNVSLNLRDNEFVAILGPSGSGKTTLVKLLLRLYDPTGGSVKLGGRDIRDYTLDSYRDEYNTPAYFRISKCFLCR